MLTSFNVKYYFQVQGQTVREPTAVVVDLKHCRDPGQVYVTISRAQKLSQLFIMNSLYTDNWKASRDAKFELENSEKVALNTIKKSESDFEIITMNIRSLRKNVNEVVRMFEFNPCDVICLQETCREVWKPSAPPQVLGPRNSDNRKRSKYVR